MEILKFTNFLNLENLIVKIFQIIGASILLCTASFIGYKLYKMLLFLEKERQKTIEEMFSKMTPNQALTFFYFSGFIILCYLVNLFIFLYNK